MGLTGESKKIYQRDYMRKQRSNKVKGLTHGSNIIEVDVKTAAKLLLICKACNKEVRGLDGKVNLLSLIRDGIEGPTLLSIKGQLEG